MEFDFSPGSLPRIYLNMEYNKDIHFKQWFEKTFPIEKRYYYKDEYYKHLT